MTEIAIMVGFNNSQYFSKFFKEVEGVTPVEFKKRKRINDPYKKRFWTHKLFMRFFVGFEFTIRGR